MEDTLLVLNHEKHSWDVTKINRGQYAITGKDDSGAETCIATVDDTGDSKQNRSRALLLSKAPQLLQIADMFYDYLQSDGKQDSWLFELVEKELKHINKDE